MSSTKLDEAVTQVRSTFHASVHKTRAQDPKALRLKAMRRCPRSIGSDIIVLLASIFRDASPPRRPDSRPRRDMQLLALADQREPRERISIFATYQSADLAATLRLDDSQTGAVAVGPSQLFVEGRH